jgi:hypothetical protein
MANLALNCERLVIAPEVQSFIGENDPLFRGSMLSQTASNGYLVRSSSEELLLKPVLYFLRTCTRVYISLLFCKKRTTHCILDREVAPFCRTGVIYIYARTMVGTCVILIETIPS